MSSTESINVFLSVQGQCGNRAGADLAINEYDTHVRLTEFSSTYNPRTHGSWGPLDIEITGRALAGIPEAWTVGATGRMSIWQVEFPVTVISISGDYFTVRYRDKERGV